MAALKKLANFMKHGTKSSLRLKSIQRANISITSTATSVFC